MSMPRLFAIGLMAGSIMSLHAAVGTAPANGVAVVVNEAAHKVDVTIDGKPFTSYMWGNNQRKPILYPLISSDGVTLTRGNPPLPGERTDHPHHTGLWFNYSNVNNIDYWNNSDAIKPEVRAKYGSIDHDRIVSAKSGPTSGELVTESTWYPSSDVPSVGSNQQPPVLHQTTRYVFSKLTIDGKPARAIDMTVTLKALSDLRLPRRQRRNARHPRRPLPRVCYRKAGGPPRRQRRRNPCRGSDRRGYWRLPHQRRQGRR